MELIKQPNDNYYLNTPLGGVSIRKREGEIVFSIIPEPAKLGKLGTRIELLTFSRGGLSFKIKEVG